MAQGWRKTWLVAMTVSAVLIALVSVRYLVPGAPGGGPAILANRAAAFGALTLHAGLASTALLLGPWQFFGFLRARWPRLHRWIGTAYVACCLGAAAAGLALAFGTTAGPVASVGFGLLAVAWAAATWRAWRLARGHAFAAHQRWMIRSFALTFAAVTLRIQLPLAGALALDMAIAYPVISFLCWVPNLVVAELYLGARRVRLATA
jgi:uncharacterized membrane protein